jgi:hypothetical protein
MAILPHTDYRKYLLVNIDQWLLLKSYGKYHNMPLKVITDQFLTLGLIRADEVYMKEVVEDSLRPRHDGLRYVISRQDKKYLVVSPGIHDKVTKFARKKKIKLIEATRILIGLGIMAHFSADPRDNPLFESEMEIFRLITENWQKRHPDKPLEKILGPRYREKMEADVLRDIAFPPKEKPTSPQIHRPELSQKSRDKSSGLRDIMDLALIFGSGLLLAENLKLKKENQELHRMIAGNVKNSEKHDNVGEGAVAEKPEAPSS